MSGLLSSLGIEWKLLIAQVINFGILFFILWKFLYKPILKVLDERQDNAKQALAKSGEIDEKLKEMEAQKESILVEARKAGEKIIKDTEAASLILKKRLEADASASAQKIVNDAEKRIAAENEKFQSELKREMLTIVANAIEATVGKYLDQGAKQKLSEEASKEALEIEKVLVAHK